MNKDLAIILTIIYLIVIYLVYKYYNYTKKIKYMKEIKVTCSDVIIRRTYNKKYYMYFYKLKYKSEEVIISDKFRLPIFQKYIKINNKYLSH